MPFSPDKKDVVHACFRAQVKWVECHLPICLVHEEQQMRRIQSFHMFAHLKKYWDLLFLPTCRGECTLLSHSLSPACLLNYMLRSGNVLEQSWNTRFLSWVRIKHIQTWSGEIGAKQVEGWKPTSFSNGSSPAVLLVLGIATMPSSSCFHLTNAKSV